jgi:hypothetical protein
MNQKMYSQLFCIQGIYEGYSSYHQVGLVYHLLLIIS